MRKNVNYKEEVLSKLKKISSKLKKMEKEMDIYKNKLDAFLREERNLPVYAEIIGTEAVYTGVVGMHEDEDD